MHNPANKVHKVKGGRKPASDQNSVNLTKGRIWIPERGGTKDVQSDDERVSVDPAGNVVLYGYRRTG